MPRKIFPLLLSEDERRVIEKRAIVHGMKLSDFLREVAMNGKIILEEKTIVPFINQQMYVELSLIAQSVEKLATETRSRIKEHESSSRELVLLGKVEESIKKLRLKVIEDDWEHS